MSLQRPLVRTSSSTHHNAHVIDVLVGFEIPVDDAVLVDVVVGAPVAVAIDGRCCCRQLPLLVLVLVLVSAEWSRRLCQACRLARPLGKNAGVGLNLAGSGTQLKDGLHVDMCAGTFSCVHLSHFDLPCPWLGEPHFLQSIYTVVHMLL